MVDSQSNFTMSRYFYVILTNGCKGDSFYTKCLQNYINGRYPSQAEAYNAKYHRKEVGNTIFPLQNPRKDVLVEER